MEYIIGATAAVLAIAFATLVTGVLVAVGRVGIALERIAAAEETVAQWTLENPDA